MFTKRAKRYLSGLTYNSSAERDQSIVPLGTIHWKDEIPAWDAFLELPEEDQASILRLFAIRSEIWSKCSLSEEDDAWWSAARSLFPQCPIFRRLHLSPDDERARDDCLEEALSFFDAMFSGATDVSITEEKGVTKVSATHKLTNGNDSDT